MALKTLFKGKGMELTSCFNMLSPQLIGAAANICDSRPLGIGKTLITETLAKSF